MKVPPCVRRMAGVGCKRLSGKVAIVTAATAGIGLGIARRLGQEGRQRGHQLP